MDPLPNEDLFDQSISSLLPKAKQGCRTAQSELFRQLQDYFLILARHQLDNQLANRLNPSDVVQESLTKAAQGIRDFRGETAAEIRAWLKAIVINEVKDLRRKHQTQKRDVRQEANLGLADESQGQPHDPQVDSRSPQSHAIANEELTKLRTILEELPSDYKTVIELRSLERLSFQQVAERMQRTPEATSKLWYRAVIAMRKRMVDRKES